MSGPFRIGGYTFEELRGMPYEPHANCVPATPPPDPQPWVYAGKPQGAKQFNAEPDPVKRLLRIVDELLERDDVTPDADALWYRKRVDEIKKELARGEEGAQNPGPDGIPQPVQSGPQPTGAADQ